MYKKWFAKTVKQVGPLTEKQLYFRVSVFGLAVFGLIYAYISWLKIPGVLNKSVADTAVVLIGLSMLLSGLCYFWNIVDSKIVYRKHLGLIGFAFAIIHLALSWSAEMKLFQITTWQQNAMWAPLTGTIALVIFAVMALISNRYSAMHLGGKWWRGILRTGYFALFLVFVHVAVLKSARWVTWYKEGMKTTPSTSLMISAFIILVILMRVALWWALKRKQLVKKV